MDVHSIRKTAIGLNSAIGWNASGKEPAHTWELKNGSRKGKVTTHK